MKLEINVPDKEIAYALCSAFEGGINYWAKSYEGNRGRSRAPVAKPWGDDYTPTYVSYPLTEGASVTIEPEEDCGGKVPKPLTLETLRAGLQLMAEQYPEHFADVLKGRRCDHGRRARADGGVRRDRVRMTARVVIRDVALGTVGIACTVDEFCRDNVDDVDACAAVLALKPGEHVDFGGGAAPHYRVTRVDE